MTEGKPTGKNIVLCSDGTGNSGGRGNGTNVWRLYQAIDLSTGDHVAFHDDGVGTQDFKLIKAISRATGFGLGRNIRELYASLVRVYDEDDRVYLFGFSRGAYTVRSLANFIDRFGVLDRHGFDTPKELEGAIFRLYDDYRREKARRDGSEEKYKDLEFCPDRKDLIEFLGVWDTVDAIGVPFDEMREWFREYMPWKHHAYELNSSIKAACHALAIDDERKTFDPTMFNEEEKGHTTVEQVWFAGVHSNIGGGYPKDQVAYNSLVWMMKNAADSGLCEDYTPLRFHDGVLQQYQDAANPHGKIYDSRSGLAAYYRPNPRDLSALCKKAKAGSPKIHSSATVRISRRTAGYAPHNIPKGYEVVDAETDTTSYLCKKNCLGSNTKFMERAAGFTTWRKCLYVTFLMTTLVFAVVVVWQMIQQQDIEVDEKIRATAGLFKTFMPDFLAGAVDAAFQRVGWLVGFAGLFGLMFWMRGFLKQLVGDLAGMGWRAVYLEAARTDSSSADEEAKMEETKEAARKKQLALLEKQRERIGGSTWAAVAWAAGKTRFGQWVWSVIWISLIVGGVFLVGCQHPAADRETACSGMAETAAEGSGRITRFETSNPCYRTGIRLTAGKNYVTKVTAEDWCDASIPARPDGFDDKTDADRWYMQLFELLLRGEDVLGDEKPGYFVLMGQIADTEGTAVNLVPPPFTIIDPSDPIGDPNPDRCKDSDNTGSVAASSRSTLTGKFTAPTSGELIVFVNDVVCPYCPSGTFAFYANNSGTATIAVEEAK